MYMIYALQNSSETMEFVSEISIKINNEYKITNNALGKHIYT
jgi:hypothetical protein